MKAPIRSIRSATLIAAVCAAFAVAPAAAQATPASFGISSFTDSVSSNQAGAHADFTTSFAFNTESRGGPAGQVRSVTAVLPPGLLGDPQAIPRCNAAELSEFDCQPSAQVGVLTTHFSIPAEEGFTLPPFSEEPDEFEEQTPVYNTTPTPGHPATLATQLSFATVLIQTDVTADGSYRLVAHVDGISTLVPVLSSSLSIWGVPADHSHDAQRFGPPPTYTTPTPAGVGPAPFMFNSSDCSDGPLPAQITVQSWEGQTATASTQMPAPEGCAALSADPSLQVSPETAQAGAPSGYDIAIGVPQELAPYSRATPDLRDATLTFPAGVSVSPSAANGLGACSAAQIGLATAPGQTPIRFSEAPAACPNSAKVGSVAVQSPALDHPLSGSLYVAQPYENPFDSLLAVYIAIEDPQTGIIAKLAGHTEANPVTGQLSTAFTENPQLPLSEIKVHLFGGPGAVLSNPTSCGQATTTAALTFYNSPTPLSRESSFNVSGCGPAKFSPAFSAGASNPKAGAFSPFSLTLSRTDDEQDLGALAVKTPRGLAAILAGLTPCPEPQAQSGNCPANSRIGHVTAAAGPGPLPFYLPQQGTENPVYLTTPYKGAPYGLSVVVPAIAGPFDLGTVVVRSKIEVDPETAQVSVISDPLPQILQGIPLQTRTVHVEIDRPAFTFNPTGCDQRNVAATVTSAQGMIANPTSPFAASGCRALKFGPKLSLNLKGKTKRGANPALRATVTYPKGPFGTYSNIASAQVALPHSEFLDQGHIGTVCTRVQFAAGPGNGAGCPAASVYGHATATSPVLAKPLSGPVFLRSSSHKLPDLVAVLHGAPTEPLTVALDGRIDSFKGGIRSSFEAVPDVPVSGFTLEMAGGKKGLLENSTDLCKSTNRATVDFTAQNGKVSDTTPVVANSCAKKHRKRSSKGH